MAITKEQAVARLPELERFTNAAQWESVIAAAEAQVNRNRFGALADEAVIHLVGHMLVSNESAAATGGREVASESMGPISISYVTSSSGSSSSELSSTRYGSEFLRLARSRVGARFFVSRG